MEKEIEIIKSLINDLKREEKLIGYNAEVEIQALENLIKGYRELEKYYEEQNEVNAKFILKSKIKEKIEKLEKEKEKTYTQFLECNRNNDTLSTKGKMLEGATQVLQELMEDK